ncbi:MAG: hypothetical protein E5X49_16635 [Mesorhizobium sp.]|nr:MAG: hypothetical protein EOQ28_25750 [Mesorhizobium sp.]RWB97448.1 MAG: hypothetical protein EOQ57_24635 [Mesorhizobium sp.]RWG76561.1 MAG: hypothetical protein EOQ69_31440 [Mesorhizobium sp.]RWJ96310.1 MAG: hypothetical protein EOR42_30270 [Mesorhizobium sp.]RWK20312.1 MAG: hypothetical protein EOR43_21900 [Mesorhizobium sp.]
MREIGTGRFVSSAGATISLGWPAYNEIVKGKSRGDARSFQRFIESPNRSNYLFFVHSGRKTVTHFSWNCSRCDCRRSPSRP